MCCPLFLNLSLVFFEVTVAIREIQRLSASNSYRTCDPLPAGFVGTPQSAAAALRSRRRRRRHRDAAIARRLL